MANLDVIKDFLEQLIEKDLIVNNRVNKEAARDVWDLKYKKSSDGKSFNFVTALKLMRSPIGVLEEPDDLAYMQVRQDILRNFLSKSKAPLVPSKGDKKNPKTSPNKSANNQKQKAVAKRDNKTKKNKIKKITYVDQNVAFRRDSQPKEEQVEGNRECLLCEIEFETQELFEEHLNEDEHKFRKAFYVTKKSAKKIRGIKVSMEGHPNLFDLILSDGISQSYTLVVTNNSKRSFVLSEIEHIKINYVTPNFRLPCELQAKSTIKMELTACIANEFIDFLYPILFQFEDRLDNSRLCFATELIFRVYPEELKDLLPVEPYKGPTHAVYQEVYEEIIRGQPPKRNRLFQKPAKPLGLFPLKSEMVYFLNVGLQKTSNMSPSQVNKLNNIQNLLRNVKKPNFLTTSNYCTMLELLLNMEEHQLIKDIHDFDRDNQVLLKQNDLYKLVVEGLSEKRPSLIRGDSVYVKEDQTSKNKYEGIVHKVEMESVSLGFAPEFDKIFLPNKKFFVSFSFNRLPIRTEHRAVSLTKSTKITKFLFPNKIGKQVLENKLKFFNVKVENNEEQKQAILYIMKKTAFPAPYLLFGPPGTGKTFAIVEAICQVYKAGEEKILVCAPSNNAANELARRLVEYLPHSDIFRYISETFPYNEIPSNLKNSINYDREGFYYPNGEELKKKRILVTTLITASRLISADIKDDHFGYVFVDEAGHATETETLIPIAGLVSFAQKSNKQTQVVLAGDLKQLGPIIHSNKAKEYGFDISMMERLMNLPIYKKDANGKYNPSAVTKLLNNYRSHKAIIGFSNEQFYDEELRVVGDNLINMAVGWKELPNSQFPVMFHSVFGADSREQNSPSFFNLREIEAVLSYVNRLIGEKLSGRKISQKDIAIISPYKKQVEKLRKACKKRDHNDILIGSVEQIQGQERLIVIMTTVRSKPEFIKYDLKFNLGFLKNPKRLNVALTRARALLIIVGNPNVLQYDHHWKELLKYVQRNGGLTGQPFKFNEESDNVLDALAEKVESLQIKDLVDQGDKPNTDRAEV